MAIDGERTPWKMRFERRLLLSRNWREGRSHTSHAPVPQEAVQGGSLLARRCSINSRYLAVLFESGYLALFDINALTLVRSINVLAESCTALVLDPLCTDLLAVGQHDAGVRVRRAPTLDVVHVLPVNQVGRGVRFVALMHPRLVVASESGISCWHLEKPTLVWRSSWTADVLVDWRRGLLWTVRSFANVQGITRFRICRDPFTGDLLQARKLEREIRAMAVVSTSVDHFRRGQLECILSQGAGAGEDLFIDLSEGDAKTVRIALKQPGVLLSSVSRDGHLLFDERSGLWRIDERGTRQQQLCSVDEGLSHRAMPLVAADYRRVVVLWTATSSERCRIEVIDFGNRAQGPAASSAAAAATAAAAQQTSVGDTNEGTVVWHA